MYPAWHGIPKPGLRTKFPHVSFANFEIFTGEMIFAYTLFFYKKVSDASSTRLS